MRAIPGGAIGDRQVCFPGQIAHAVIRIPLGEPECALPGERARAGVHVAPIKCPPVIADPPLAGADDLGADLNGVNEEIAVVVAHHTIVLEEQVNGLIGVEGGWVGIGIGLKGRAGDRPALDDGAVNPQGHARPDPAGCGAPCPDGQGRTAGGGIKHTGADQAISIVWILWRFVEDLPVMKSNFL